MLPSSYIKFYEHVNKTLCLYSQRMYLLKTAEIAWDLVLNSSCILSSLL